MTTASVASDRLSRPCRRSLDIPCERAQYKRRLAAILAADVVGYSRPMAANEAGTIARLSELRKHLELSCAAAR